MRVLQENNIQLYHPFEIIAFADEERTMIGSKAIAGTALEDPERYDIDSKPTPSKPVLKRVGGDWHNLQSAQSITSRSRLLFRTPRRTRRRPRSH